MLRYVAFKRFAPAPQTQNRKVVRGEHRRQRIYSGLRLNERRAFLAEYGNVFGIDARTQSFERLREQLIRISDKVDFMCEPAYGGQRDGLSAKDYAIQRMLHALVNRRNRKSQR